MPRRHVRRHVSWLIARACLQLRLGASVHATAQQTSQRALQATHVRRRGAVRTASAVIWLCTKRCETPRGARDVLRCVIRAEARRSEGKHAHVDVVEGDVSQLADDERAVLVATSFHVPRCHVHAYVLALLQALDARDALAERSWNAAHDAMRTRAGASCVDEAVACAAVAVSMDDVHVQAHPQGSTGWFQDVLPSDPRQLQQAMDAYRALKKLYRTSTSADVHLHQRRVDQAERNDASDSDANA
mmetsp:Transcript_78/g.223  ORF Transcript_78/g.223 Transcript_78/m.223 type:complete len:245 (-) Transcript_78:1770-2504(-)